MRCFPCLKGCSSFLSPVFLVDPCSFQMTKSGLRSMNSTPFLMLMMCPVCLPQAPEELDQFLPEIQQARLCIGFTAGVACLCGVDVFELIIIGAPVS